MFVTENVPDDTSLKAENKASSRPNKVRIPKLERVADFSQASIGTFDRKYAGVMLLDNEKHFVLQRRDNNRDTFNAGKLAMFGGRLETDETPIECAIRELGEETTIKAAERDLVALADLIIMREDRTKTLCTIFVLENANISEITLQEGQRYELLSREQAVSSPELTHLCRAAIVEYMKL